MVEENRRSTRRSCYQVTIKNFIQCVGTVLVPLLLAIFTVIITFQQRDESNQQRLQDLNISREQREQDKRNANEKLNADDINAEKQRNMSRDQREHELQVEQQRYEQDRTMYLDNLLLSYYNEIGQLLLKETNGTLSSNSIVLALAHAKTLNVIEQVGHRKAVHLIKFLYDANQLTLGTKSLDLTDAQLNNIDLSYVQTLQNVYFKGAHLNNASFAGKDLSYATFLNIQLRGANFSETNLSFAIFQNVDLTDSTFKEAFGINTYFEYCKMEHNDFTNVHFNITENSGVSQGFIDSTLTSSVFRNAVLLSIRFLFCNMTAVDFTNAIMKKADLTGSALSFSLFRNAQLDETKFLSTNLSYADFRNSSCREDSILCRISTSLSLGNTILSDGKVMKPSNPLINYGHPQCNLSIPLPIHVVGTNGWIAKPTGTVFLEYRELMQPNLGKSGCVFTVQHDILTQVNLSYRISLGNYFGIINVKRAKATVRCQVGYDTQIILTQINSKGREISESESIGLRWQEILDQHTAAVMITIKFRLPYQRESTWCHYVELYIEPVIKAPGYQLFHPWNSAEL